MLRRNREPRHNLSGLSCPELTPCKRIDTQLLQRLRALHPDCFGPPGSTLGYVDYLCSCECSPVEGHDQVDLAIAPSRDFVREYPTPLRICHRDEFVDLAISIPVYEECAWRHQVRLRPIQIPPQ